MFSGGVGDSLQIVGTGNSRIVTNPDPENPVIARQSEEELDFMMLMVEQLRNQDPMDPMDTKDYTTMLTQLNSLDQLTSINRLLEQSYSANQMSEATALIGRYVEGLDSQNNYITGIVERVELIEGEATLKVGDQLLLVPQLLLVDDNPPE